MPEARVQICHLPTFDILVDQRITKGEAREQLDLPQDIPILLFFGIVREYKGLQDLLVALPRIREQLGKLLLMVAGEFWDDEQPYLETIQRLGIEDSVLLDARYIPNETASVYFSAADLFVAPYRRVTGSASVQMATGFGLPVVTTQTGSLAETESKRLGLLVPPADPDALATTIIQYFAGNLEPAMSQTHHQAQDSWAQLVATIEALVQEEQQ
jgi:glycosyltransferase involved in cell wall biosynthesis